MNIDEHVETLDFVPLCWHPFKISAPLKESLSNGW